MTKIELLENYYQRAVCYYAQETYEKPILRGEYQTIYYSETYKKACKKLIKDGILELVSTENKSIIVKNKIPLSELETFLILSNE